MKIPSAGLMERDSIAVTLVMAGLTLGVSSFNAAGVGSHESGDRFVRRVTPSGTGLKTRPVKSSTTKGPTEIGMGGLTSEILRRRCRTGTNRPGAIPRASVSVGGNLALAGVRKVWRAGRPHIPGRSSGNTLYRRDRRIEDRR